MGAFDAGALDASGGDGGQLDGGELDAGPDERDGGRRDGGVDAFVRDTGTPRRLRVLDAVEDVDGRPIGSFQVAYGGEVRDLDFGCVTTFTVPASESTATLAITVDSGAPVERTLSVDDDLLVVLARNELSVSTSVLVDVPPSAGSMRYLDVLRTGGLAVTVTGGGAAGATVAFGEWTPEQDLAETVAVTVRPPLAFSPVPVAWFSFGVTDGLVVLTGDGNRHPASVGGPRSISVPALEEGCGAPNVPDPMFSVVNLPRDRNALGGAADVFACQLDSSEGAQPVNAGGLSPVLASSAGRAVLGLASDRGAACSSTARIVDTAGATTPGHRYLVVVSGPVEGRTPADWLVSWLEELPPTVEGRYGAGWLHAASDALGATIDVLDDADGSVLLDALAPLAGRSVEWTRPPWTPALRVRDHGSRATLESYGAAGGSEVGGGFVIFADTRLSVAPVAAWAYTVRAPLLQHWSIVERRPRLAP